MAIREDQVIRKETMQKYHHLTTPNMQASVSLTRAEQCVVLLAYDYGLTALSHDEQAVLNSVLLKLKDKIWP